MTELKVIMPVYNEEAGLGQYLRRWVETLRRLGIDFGIHAYNDGSKDRSLQVLSETAADYPEIMVHDKPNSGHGPTIIQGFLENLDCRWLLQVDSDDEIDPSNFASLWEARQGFDFVIGNRVTRRDNAVRRFVTATSRLTVRLLYGRGVSDANCPFRLMRTEAFRAIFAELPAGAFAPNVMISGMACLRGLRIAEVPVSYHFRTTGTASLNRVKVLKAATRSFGQTLAHRWGIRP